MRILFDQGTPAPLRKALIHHDVATAYEMGLVPAYEWQSSQGSGSLIRGLRYDRSKPEGSAESDGTAGGGSDSLDDELAEAATSPSRDRRRDRQTQLRDFVELNFS
jgi:hypothetical protein